MLDENLPTFQFHQSPDNPYVSAVYFSRNGDEPAPEYAFERAHPTTNPAAARKYAVALKDPHATDVVYAEVVVSPKWEQPTLSAAELRAQGQAQPAPMIPDTFTIQLYDPDQAVTVRYIPGSLTKTDSWEFEMLSQSFKLPSASQLDRQNSNGGEPRVDFRPRIMFKWKRDSRLTRDMTCYNVGKSLGKHKSKEPDITVALFKMGRESAVTVYEPNLRRVEMEDRKGLDIVLVIGAEVIRDMYLAPEKKPDLFNIGSGAPAAVMANGKRKNSRPSPPPVGAPATVSGSMARPPRATGPTGPTAPAMSGALGSMPSAMAAANVPTAYNNHSTFPSSRPTNSSGVDAETERLRRMVDDENRREAMERERRDREEAKRIERMLKDEEKENRRRQAEVDKETERLKKLYGVDGQGYVTSGGGGGGQPPGPGSNGGYQPPPQQHFAPPPRPSSVGPGATGPGFGSSTLSSLFSTKVSPQQGGSSRPSGSGSGRPSQGGPYMSGSNAFSGFFQNVLDPKKNPRPTKKKSMQW